MATRRARTITPYVEITPGPRRRFSGISSDRRSGNGHDKTQGTRWRSRKAVPIRIRATDARHHRRRAAAAEVKEVVVVDGKARDGSTYNRTLSRTTEMTDSGHLLVPMGNANVLLGSTFNQQITHLGWTVAIRLVKPRDQQA